MKPLLRKLRRAWSQFRRQSWLASNNASGYFHALDDVWDSLDRHNPCHDEVRMWIVNRKRELVGRDPIER